MRLTPEQILAGVRVVRIAEAGISLDPRNANRHTPRGLDALGESIAEDGIVRPVAVAADLQMIAGEATIETAAAAGIDEAVIIPTDGHRLIIHQRVDVPGGSEQARRMGVRDNRVAELDLAWDPAVLQALADDGAELAGLFSDEEFAALMSPGEPAAPEPEPAVPEPEPQKEPQTKSEVLVEIRCTQRDLDQMRATLDGWGQWDGVTVSIA